MLFISSIICFIITVALPYSPLAGPLGLDPLPYKIILSIIGITAAYALTAEWLKIYFFRKSEG
jgi:Mg2+-importing ATPase